VSPPVGRAAAAFHANGFRRIASDTWTAASGDRREMSPSRAVWGALGGTLGGLPYGRAVCAQRREPFSPMASSSLSGDLARTSPHKSPNHSYPPSERAVGTSATRPWFRRILLRLRSFSYRRAHSGRCSRLSQRTDSASVPAGTGCYSVPWSERPLPAWSRYDAAVPRSGARCSDETLTAPPPGVQTRISNASPGVGGTGRMRNNAKPP